MVRKIKYLNTLMAREIPMNIAKCLEEQPARSGMYNWLFVHSGDIKPFWRVNTKEELEKYDVVQVNMSPKDMPIIPMIRDLLKNSDTKLVINNDYVAECWGNWPVDPYYYKMIQKMGDMVFSTEPHQVSNMIPGTFTIPHPSNTKALKKLGTDYETNGIGFLFHWWAGMTHIPAMNCDIAKEKFRLDYSSVYGYSQKWDEMKDWGKAQFDRVFELLNFPDFAERIQGEKIVYDPNPYHTYGRNGVELACFKKPVVGSNRVLSYNMLFPDFTIDPFDRNDTLKKFKKVIDNSETTQNQIQDAYEKVEYFGYEQSRDRWFKAFDEAIDRGGYKWHK